MITVYIDGGARGNPGPAGFGVRVEDAAGTMIDELYGGLGVATNNVAEYNGLLAALNTRSSTLACSRSTPRPGCSRRNSDACASSTFAAS